MKRGPWRTSQAVWTPNSIELIFGSREVSHEGLYPSSRKALWYLPYVEITHTKKVIHGAELTCKLKKKFSTFIFEFYLFIWLCQVLAGACRSSIFARSIWILSFGMWDLVPWPGIESAPPALGVKSLSHWTTREAPQLVCVCVCVCVCVSSVVSDSLWPHGW